MAAIRVLDQHTAELIAAGEVVERPASVVKELLENAIDAGATQVSVSIEKGGISLIQVADNGTGIPAEDLPTAFIRHATSKISSEEDLDNIHTLGFRGEALPSIASVARVKVLTCTEQDEFACVYRIEGGQEMGIEPSARPIGTTMEVRDLFYNTPARMKFLKKDSSEAGFVGETVGHIALSHPEVSIAYVKDGKTQYKTPGDGKLRSAVYAVLGREFAKDLLDVDGTSGGYRLQGLITPPRSCRASRGMQHFFINGRYVKNRTMMAALENAYRGTLMQGKFPGCVLMLTMPCDMVDVNVHPAKTEVRFSREKDVFDAVYRTAKMALTTPGSGEQELELSRITKQPEPPHAEEPVKTEAPEVKPMPAVPAQHIEAERNPAITVVKAKEVTISAPTFDAKQQDYWQEPDIMVEVPAIPTVRPYSQNSVHSDPLPIAAHGGFNPKRTFYDEPDVMVEPKEVQKPISEPKIEPQQEAFCEPQQLSALPDQQKAMDSPEKSQRLPLEYLGEAFKTYIITQRGEEICFIDKHAAHERILYEKLAASYGNPGSQLLLVPVTVNLSAEEKQAVLENTQLLLDAGIEAEDFGGSTMLVRTVPADIPVNDAEGLLCELAAKLAKGSQDARSEYTEWVLHSIACRAAVKAGDKSDKTELMRLAEDILDEKVPPFCPHGRPVVLRLTRKELEKQFGRLG